MISTKTPSTSSSVERAIVKGSRSRMVAVQ
jgi:hypothetical protein